AGFRVAGGSVAAGVEPAGHDAVQYRRVLDVRKMACLLDLLVPSAGDKRRDAFVRARRRPLIVGTANHQGRNLERRQAWREIEILDRRRATKKTTRGGAENSVANLPPAAGI